MATGSGKTVVMAMLIAWQALNKLANPQDKRFTDTFLVVTPGITIRDRLRVLLPERPGQLLRGARPRHARAARPAPAGDDRDHQLPRLPAARDKIQACQPHQEDPGGPRTTDRFKETPAEMVRRVCRELRHARRTSSSSTTRRTTATRRAPQEAADGGDARRRRARRGQAERRGGTRLAHGLEAVRDKLGIRAVYDLSATPFFLKGSGYPEGTLFPWVVSDFGLMDAIESGIVKIPRVPVADDSMTGDRPDVPRPVAPRSATSCPRRAAATRRSTAEPILPKELEGALRSLYADYETALRRVGARAGMGTPPVFIVVCSNTTVASSSTTGSPAGRRRSPTARRSSSRATSPLFSNEEDGRWRDRPNTLLVDSAQLDRGDALDPAFKKAAAAEIERVQARVPRSASRAAAPRTSPTRTSCARS